MLAQAEQHRGDFIRSPQHHLIAELTWLYCRLKLRRKTAQGDEHDVLTLVERNEAVEIIQDLDRYRLLGTAHLP